LPFLAIRFKRVDWRGVAVRSACESQGYLFDHQGIRPMARQPGKEAMVRPEGPKPLPMTSHSRTKPGFGGTPPCAAAEAN
jgi:hypothetical protein